MKRKNFYLTDPQIEQLELLAKELDLSVSEIVRRMIDKGLEET